MTFSKIQIAAHVPTPTIVPEVVVDDGAATAALLELMAEAARGRARHTTPLRPLSTSH